MANYMHTEASTRAISWICRLIIIGPGTTVSLAELFGWSSSDAWKAHFHHSTTMVGGCASFGVGVRASGGCRLIEGLKRQ
jgi:hypothetical protein